ncbi:unnamed protein product [Bursaphelenchus okinawaensis]|uniref:Uncharacterized protein n=1 Tax=Bursaphelenchus okinawaensis TaxID=465554 RepID=A0A811K1X4_9BILA|nr:unnamed protein product [Bursaphelenchus okinawaensis]CAG9089448.1 unnamed protein product [Bursaphelenchus okinawaensis]
MNLVWILIFTQVFIVSRCVNGQNVEDYPTVLVERRGLKQMRNIQWFHPGPGRFISSPNGSESISDFGHMYFKYRNHRDDPQMFKRGVFTMNIFRSDHQGRYHISPTGSPYEIHWRYGSRNRNSNLKNWTTDYVFGGFYRTQKEQNATNSRSKGYSDDLTDKPDNGDLKAFMGEIKPTNNILFIFFILGIIWHVLILITTPIFIYLTMKVAHTPIKSRHYLIERVAEIKPHDNQIEELIEIKKNRDLDLNKVGIPYPGEVYFEYLQYVKQLKEPKKPKNKVQRLPVQEKPREKMSFVKEILNEETLSLNMRPRHRNGPKKERTKPKKSKSKSSKSSGSTQFKIYKLEQTQYDSIIDTINNSKTGSSGGSSSLRNRKKKQD